MKHVPNILSGARLVAAPYVFLLLWTREYRAALIWFAIIGATDGFDGYIARRFDAKSKLGAVLDPIADKVLMSGAFVVLAMTGAIPVWMAWLVLGRDVAIVLGALVLLAITKTRRDFPPTFAGKLSTTLQIIYVLTVTAAGAGLVGRGPETLAQWLVIVVTSWSGLDYARVAMHNRPN